MDEITPLSLQLLINGIAGLLVKWLKLHPSISWLGPESVSKLRWIATLSTLAATLGVHYAFEGTLMTGSTITLMLPGLPDIINGAVGLMFQDKLQQGLPPGMMIPPTPAERQPTGAAPLTILKQS